MKGYKRRKGCEANGGFEHPMISNILAGVYRHFVCKTSSPVSLAVWFPCHWSFTTVNGNTQQSFFVMFEDRYTSGNAPSAAAQLPLLEANDNFLQLSAINMPIGSTSSKTTHTCTRDPTYPSCCKSNNIPAPT